MLNIFYVHSPICWEASLIAKRHFNNEPSLYISARSYKPPIDTAYHINYDCFFTLYNAAAIGIEFNYMIQRFLSPQHNNARLFIPHAVGPVTQLLGAHTLVKEIYFLEEGDLAYTEAYCKNPSKILSFFSKKSCADISTLLARHGFDGDQANDLLQNFYCEMLFDLHGKVRGVCKFSELAFERVPGKHLMGRLKCENQNFLEKTLVLLPPITDPACLKWVKEKRGSLESQIKNIRPGFIFKKHPACNIEDYPDWIYFHLKSGISWTDLVGVRDGHREVSQFRFEKVYILGESSAARYFKLTQPETPVILLG